MPWPRQHQLEDRARGGAAIQACAIVHVPRGEVLRLRAAVPRRLSQRGSPRLYAPTSRARRPGGRAEDDEPRAKGETMSDHVALLRQGRRPTRT